MIRISVLVCLLVVAGCADQSKGSALNECRVKHYLDANDTQQQAIPDCMKAKSFEMTSGCNAQPDEEEWDWQVQAFPYDNSRCYRSIGAAAWTATLLSPM
jgi:hypothetical protein